MKQRSVIIALFIVLVTSLSPTVANAQSGADDYGVRIRSRDGQWLAPAATLVLGSTDDEHIGRGSINSWDWSAKVGSPVFASRAGTVEAAGCNLYESRKWPIMQGYGCAVSIKHDGGVVSQYGHCAEGSIRVQVGDQVNEWTQLCNVGRTGVTSFDHTHFTILVNGAPIRIDGVFDISQMKRCHLCSGKNDPMGKIAKSGGSSEESQALEPARNAETVAEATRSTNALAAVLYKLGKLPTQTLATIMVLGMFLFFVMPSMRKVTVLGVMVSCAVLFVSEVPVANLRAGNSVAHAMPAQPEAQAVSVVDVDEVWDKAYAFMRGWEGGPNPKCVRDPYLTWKGVLDSTYKKYRISKGLPAQSVCGNMTEDEAQEIYYDMYWVKSGASEIAKTNPKLATSVFDFAVTAGAEQASPPLQLLQQCGGINCDPKVYNDLREQFYKSRETCSQFCVGWLRRVADIRKITQ